MDPRHPELAIGRMNELLKQFNGILARMKTESVASKLGEEEREGTLVVQEICLVAPRLHESMMQVSRTRRAALAHGLANPVEEPKPEPVQIVTDVENPDSKIAVHNAKPEEYIEKPKKKATKKKTTKKKAE